MQLDPIFHAYDIRGTYPDQINETAVKRIAMAYARFIRSDVAALRQAQGSNRFTVAVGRDVRLSGPKLMQAVINGLKEAGVDVVDIGSVPTELLYFAVGYYHFDGGIQVSASHNPPEFNGLKVVRAGVAAISGDTGLMEIKKLAESTDRLADIADGELESRDVTEDYFDFLTKFVHFDTIRPVKIVANANFGLSGQAVAKLLARLGTSQIQLIELNCQPDGNFPKGRPDPLIPANRIETSELIKATQADFGVAWDGDGDRFFVTDEKGVPIEGCHLTALLAQYLLGINQGEKIIYDPRNIWAVEKTVKEAGGTALICKAGHAFFKNKMRSVDAIFGGEMSGHLYFRDFYFADNGLIPFLMFLNIVAANDKSVSEIVRPLREKYFISGEINFEVSDKAAMLATVKAKYPDGQVNLIDGLSVSFPDWRFNLRPSNTENLLRLNVEALDQKTCDQKTVELTEIIKRGKGVSIKL